MLSVGIITRLSWVYQKGYTGNEISQTGREMHCGRDCGTGYGRNCSGVTAYLGIGWILSPSAGPPAQLVVPRASSTFVSITIALPGCVALLALGYLAVST